MLAHSIQALIQTFNYHIGLISKNGFEMSKFSNKFFKTPGPKDQPVKAANVIVQLNFCQQLISVIVIKFVRNKEKNILDGRFRKHLDQLDTTFSMENAQYQS